MRYQDWEARLHGFCSARRGVPFTWGANDCALFVADAVQAISGVDLASGCRGRYSSAHEADVLLEGLCGGDLEKFAAQQAEAFGFPEVGVRFAQRGDMVLFQQYKHCSLGIVSLDGRRVLLMHEQDGLIRLPVLIMARAWRVC